jgi:hypothetical protein
MEGAGFELKDVRSSLFSACDDDSNLFVSCDSTGGEVTFSTEFIESVLLTDSGLFDIMKTKSMSAGRVNHEKFPAHPKDTESLDGLHHFGLWSFIHLKHKSTSSKPPDLNTGF